MLTTNMIKSINAFIRDAHALPIMALVEYIHICDLSMVLQEKRESREI